MSHAVGDPVYYYSQNKKTWYGPTTIVRVDSGTGHVEVAMKPGALVSPDVVSMTPNAPSSVSAACFSQVAVGDVVQWLSTKHGTPFDMVVTAVNSVGSVQLSLKPGVWITPREQAARMTRASPAAAASQPNILQTQSTPANFAPKLFESTSNVEDASTLRPAGKRSLLHSRSMPVHTSSSTSLRVASIEAELLQATGPRPETRKIVSEDNLVLLEDLLKRKPRLAHAFANAKDVMEVASIRCRDLVESHLSLIPFANVLPSTVSRDVYEAAIRLALQYAGAGVEGNIHGHILVLGDPDALLALGTRNKFDPLRDRRGDIRDAADAEEVRRCMDADGMTVIDGRSGAPVANKFFSSGTSANAGGGARSKSALWMAEQAAAIVIKVSEDSKGEITVHCGDGPNSKPLTAQHDCSCRGTSDFGGRLAVRREPWAGCLFLLVVAIASVVGASSWHRRLRDR